MNELRIFNYNENTVRTTEIDGEPWFVLKDVCEVLGLDSSHKVAARLDADELTGIKLRSGGQVREMIAINESGLYNVILRSDKPEAKPFRKWVTAEVLPSIRKHGGYLAGQEAMSPEELMAIALLLAQKTIEARDARISALTVQNQIMAPKAEYFDAIVDRNLLTNFRETAKQLGVGEKVFIRFLLDQKFIYRDQKGKLQPYAEKNTGLFELKECLNEKTGWGGVQTLITPKGRETFRLLTMGLQ